MNVENLKRWPTVINLHANNFPVSFHALGRGEWMRWQAMSDIVNRVC